MSITIYGASDDTIQIDGDISDEWYLQDNEAGDLVAFSDGTILRIAFTNGGADGIWRITPVARGAAQLTIEQALEDDEDNYTDRATLDGAVWAVHGIGWAGLR